jgi:tRNA threonylcarbamoyladenosine biosynthesis protein TsaB
MKILIIDTSTRRNWVALFEDERMLGCLHFEDQQSCLINLVPGIQHVLTNAGTNLQAIDCIGTVIGPGAWSSLRIGLATVKQLCLTNHLPLMRMTSSQVIAEYANLIGITRPTLLTVMDAGGGKVYSAHFQREAGSYIQIKADAWQTAESTAQELASAPDVAIIGDGAGQFEPFHQPGWERIVQQPQADSRYLGSIASRARDETHFDADAIRLLKPLYVQLSSAELDFNLQVT